MAGSAGRIVSLRCGCPNDGDDIVFGSRHKCDVLDAEARLPRLIPSWRFVVPETSEGVAADNLQQELDRLEPRYLETLDADERGGH